MPESTYSIAYRVENDGARAEISALRGDVVAFDATVAGSKSGLASWGKSAATAARNLAAIGKSLDGLKSATATLQTLSFSVQVIDRSAASAAKSLGLMATALGRFGKASQGVQDLASELWRTSNGAIAADANIEKLASGIGSLGARAGDVGRVRDQVVGVQRAAYGARKNFEDLSGAMGGLGGKVGGINAATTGLKSVGVEARSVSKSIRSAGASTRRFGGALGGLAARIAVFQGLKTAIEGAGQALKDAREAADQGGRKNLDLRDTYRELANLQGKAGPDNEVVAGALRFRLATGATDQEANDSLRRFEGGLPAAVAAGNIQGNSTSGVAGDFFKEAVRTSNRVGIDGGTAGLLASKIAQTTKVPDVETGLSQFGTIVDLLNRGDGDLSPLTKSLVNTAGGLVGGKGGAFQGLPQLAAALEVASLNAGPAAAGTRVRQAVTALGRFGDRGKAKAEAGILTGEDLDKFDPKERADRIGEMEHLTEDAFGKLSGAERESWVVEHGGEKQWAGMQADPKKQATYWQNQFRAAREASAKAGAAGPKEVKAGDTLERLKITPNMRFEDKIDALAPIIDGAENADVALRDAGWRNQAERRALIQFYNNRKLLRDETAAADKGVPAADVRAKNRGFFAGRTAQDRIAKAQGDAARFAQFDKDENLQIGREGAEARLRDKGDLDTGASNFSDFMVDLAPVRIAGAAFNSLAGRETPADALPIFLGGKKTKQLRIDDEAMKRLQEQAGKVGIQPDRFFANQFGGAQSSAEDRFSALSKEVQARGGNPFGGGGATDAQLREMVREQQRTNKLLEDQARNKNNLPARDRNDPGRFDW